MAKIRLWMLSKKGDGISDSGAGFEQAFGRISPNALHTGTWFPILVEASHPVAGEAFRVQAASGPTINIADVRTAIIPVAGRNEPNPRLRVRPILVIAEQRPVGIGKHENGAGVNRRGNNGENSQDMSQSLQRSSRQESDMNSHSCDSSVAERFIHEACAALARAVRQHGS